MLIAQDNAAHGTRGMPANGLAYFLDWKLPAWFQERGAAVPMTAPGRRPVRAGKWVIRRAPHQGLPVPHPVLSEARSSMSLIRFAFWTQSAESRVQCSGVVRPHADCRCLRRFQARAFPAMLLSALLPPSAFAVCPGWLTASHARGLRGLRDARPWRRPAVTAVVSRCITKPEHFISIWQPIRLPPVPLCIPCC
jgi:hypothetical protein